MKVKQLIWKNNSWEGLKDITNLNPQLCLLFGTRRTLESGSLYKKELQERFADVDLVISSTAGNIYDETLLDDVIVANLIQFEHTKVKTDVLKFEERDGYDLGVKLGELVEVENTAYSLIFSSMGINADQILKGFNSIVKGRVPMSGGVAGDNYDFVKTIVGVNDDVDENQLVLVSFLGDRLHTQHGSKGGWDIFGPERKVTKCERNILYEIDGKPALDLYKKYLGEKSVELPISALHFPLAYIDPITNEYIVRGVQNIDEENKSMILFGDLQNGDTIQLMKANMDRVIKGAEDSASQSKSEKLGDPDFSLLISCVARRLVLDQLVEEELSEAKQTLGKETIISGFYSYSELSPVVGDNACHLHNQTMTITSFYER